MKVKFLLQEHTFITFIQTIVEDKLRFVKGN